MPLNQQYYPKTGTAKAFSAKQLSLLFIYVLYFDFDIKHLKVGQNMLHVVNTLYQLYQLPLFRPRLRTLQTHFHFKQNTLLKTDAT